MLLCYAMYGRGGCVANSNKSIRKIDEQIQSLIDAENSFINDSYKRKNSKIKPLVQDNNLKTDTKKIQCIDYLVANEDSTDEVTKKIDSLDSKLSIPENECESEKCVVYTDDDKEDGFSITNLFMIMIIVVLIFIIIFLILV